MKPEERRTAEVRVRVKCGECENGVVAHPEWLAYNADEAQHAREKQLRDGGDSAASDQAFLEWWRERGYTTRLSPLGRLSSDCPTVPSEEIECSECEGTTWVEQWVTLTELLRPLKDGLTTLDSMLLEHEGGG